MGDVLINISVVGVALIAVSRVLLAQHEWLDAGMAVLEPKPARMDRAATIMLEPRPARMDGAPTALAPRPEIVSDADTSEAAVSSSPTTTVADADTSEAAVSSSPAPTVTTPSLVTAPSLPLVMDERFADNTRGWPDNPASTAWFSGGGYHLAAREPSRFVAVAVPLPSTFDEVVMTATFGKVGGPPGGGYGLIVGDEGGGPRDGLSQAGAYDVLEVGDGGEIGIWRRDEDHWVELLPWTPSDAVRHGESSNVLEVRITGQRLDLAVNGILVASREDHTLRPGGVGVFVGGDFNEVHLEQVVVRGNATQVPAAALTASAFLPITRVVIPAIGVDAPAVAAQLVHRDGAVTWEVPAFTIGHAQGTTGAGNRGNAVLVGHVSSRAAGNVFQNLHRLRPGEAVEVFGGTRRFDYVVRDVRTVSRTDLSVVQSTSEPSVTLITCTGRWLPLVGDYTQRLVVRAVLRQTMP